MTIQGKAYVKTQWAFRERPVASAKLNAWDDRIEAAFELVHFLLSQAWGGGDGVIRRAAAEDLAVVPANPPEASVIVRPGYAFISRMPYRLAEDTPTAGIAAPVSQPRIDLVEARLTEWDIAVVKGAEAAEPEAPAGGEDAIALAELYLRPGMNAIHEEDDGTNGYIIDIRRFL